MGAQSGFSRIEHVVHLMLENRSFDNVLGWLYGAHDPPARIIGRDQAPFHGLTEGGFSNVLDGVAHPVKRGASAWNTPRWDPNEEFEHVTAQLFGPGGARPGVAPGMGGFLADYATAKEWIEVGPELGSERALDILETFSPEQLTVLNGLARAYAVSDAWFASVPTQTNANRSFSLAGTSMGLVNNKGPWFGIQPVGESVRTIWHALFEHGWTRQSDWMIYFQANDLFSDLSFTELMFPHIPDADLHIAPIDAFYRSARLGLLPRYSYLEPDWLTLGDAGNDYHPPSNVLPGEQLVKRVYDALSGQLPDSTPGAVEAWSKTLLILTFDEHGGTYDHVPPPWGARPPWGDGPPPVVPEQGFGFDRFGVRVPALLISPWVEPGTVFRSETEVPYDHTSVIATLLGWAGVDRARWNMGARVASAPTFEGVLSRTSPRSEATRHTVSAEALPAGSSGARVNGMHLNLLRALLARKAGGKLSPQQIDEEADRMIGRIQSVGDLRDALSRVK